MKELPLSAMDLIIREASGLRVGLDAREALAEILEEQGAGIAREAGKYAQHANRKTVKAEDIRLAVEGETSIQTLCFGKKKGSHRIDEILIREAEAKEEDDAELRNLYVWYDSNMLEKPKTNPLLPEKSTEEQKQKALHQLEKQAHEILKLGLKFSSEKKNLMPYDRKNRLKLIRLLEDLLETPLPSEYYNDTKSSIYIEDSILHLVFSNRDAIPASHLYNYVYQDHPLIHAWKPQKTKGDFPVYEGSGNRKIDYGEIWRASPRG